MIPARSSALRRISLFVAAALVGAAPAAVLVFLAQRYAIEAPFADEWELIPLLEKSYAGRLTWADLLSQHNEQRPFFPRLLMLGIARLTGWNLRCEQMLNVALAGAALAALGWALRRTPSPPDARPLASLLPFLAIFFFSLKQWENWTMGWQLLFFLSLFAAIAGFACLLAAPRSRPAFAAALALGVIATFSAGNGLVFWPVGFLAASSSVAPQGRPERVFRLVLWSLVSATAIILYLVDFQVTAHSVSLAANFAEPQVFLLFVCSYLGSPLTDRFAVWAGAAGVVLFVGLAAPSIRARDPGLSLTLGLYAVGGAILTAAGRAHLGADEALCSRYVTFGQLLWIANLIAIWDRLLAAGEQKKPAVKNRALVPLLAAWLAILAAGVAASSSCAYRFSSRFVFLAPAQRELAALADDELLSRLYPDPKVVRERTPFLKEHRLSYFRRQGR